jgi:urease accessory protein
VVVRRGVRAMRQDRLKFVGAIGLAAVLLLLPQAAQAHSSKNLAGGFLAGFVHPFTGVDHLLAMVSVGLWGAFLGRPLIAALPVIFPAVMALGALLAMTGAPQPPLELGIALSVLVLGVAIAAAWRAPVWLACLIVAVFAVFHGFAHGTEIPSLADPIAYSTGFMLATGSLHLAGIGLGTINSVRGGAVITRGIGAAVALAGLYFLGVVVLR